MNSITHSDIRQLIDQKGHWCVSIYVPMHVEGEQNRQAPMRLKTLLRRAKAEVLRRGMGEDAVKKFFAAAAMLVDDREFWRDGGKSAAVLIGEDGTKAYHLPIACGEFVAVGRVFHVTPLIAVANTATPYFLIAVSQNRIRLLRGDRHEVREVKVAGLPQQGLKDLGYDEPEERSQTHTASPQLSGKQSVVFHGQGGAADAAKGEIESCLRLVDRAIGHMVGAADLPLIFVGVDYLFPIYREVNTCSRLWPEHISGNPDRLAAQEFRARAAELLAARQDGRWQGEIDAYWKGTSAGRTENRDEQVVRAAHEGRVETLFVDPTVRKWGRFDAATDTVRFDDEVGDGEDLVNNAAIETLRHGGTVATVPAGYIPGGGVMAATLRFAAEAPAGSAHNG